VVARHVARRGAGDPGQGDGHIGCTADPDQDGVVNEIDLRQDLIAAVHAAAAGEAYFSRSAVRF